MSTSDAPSTSPAPTGNEPEPPARVDPAFADALKLFTVLSRAHAALHEKSRQDIRRHGLTPSEFAVLEVLYHRGPLLLGNIKERILVSSGGITYLVDRLADRDLVERRNCPEDRRARYAALTARGVDLVASIFPDHARCLMRAAQGLSPEERRQAIELLKALGKGAARAPGCENPS